MQGGGRHMHGQGKLLYKVKRGPKLEKINERWQHGIFLGVRRKSNELWVGAVQGRAVQGGAAQEGAVQGGQHRGSSAGAVQGG